MVGRCSLSQNQTWSAERPQDLLTGHCNPGQLITLGIDSSVDRILDSSILGENVDHCFPKPKVSDQQAKDIQFAVREDKIFTSEKLKSENL